MSTLIFEKLSTVDHVVEEFSKYRQREISDIATFLSNWRRCYRVQQKELRRKKDNESVVDGNSTLETSLRPSRAARLTARMNIKKQAEDEDVFLKPKAMPRTKAAKKSTVEVAETKTGTSGTKQEKTLQLVLERVEKPVKKRKKSTKATGEILNRESGVKISEPEQETTTCVEKLANKTKTKKKVKSLPEEKIVEAPIAEIEEPGIVEKIIEAPVAESEPKNCVVKVGNGSKTRTKVKSSKIQPDKVIPEIVPEFVEISEGEVIGNSPSISPVPFPDGEQPRVVNESIIDASLCENNLFVDEPAKKKNGPVADLIFHDALENFNQSMSGDSVNVKPKLKRTKYRKSKLDITYDIFSPKMSSSILQVEKTATPKTALNGTFVVNKLDSPIDLFAEGVQTVIRKKKNVTVSFVEDDEDPVAGLEEVEVPVAEEVAFHAPLPVASKKRKTAQEVVYDALGNVIDRDVAKRTKVIAASKFDVLPDAADGRPVRTRTKVRRLGIDGDGEVLADSKLGESLRATRTKKKTVEERECENLAVKETLNISRKSKARRASAAMNKGTKLPSSTQKYKTPLSTVTNQIHGKRNIIMASASKDFPSSQKKPRLEMRAITKPSEKDLKEGREAKFKAKMDKEEIAAQKKHEALTEKQQKLKQKNNEKLARAKEARAKIEEEKHEMIMQSEKEKEMKRKCLLQEREEKLKAEANKKKMLAERKLAEIEERRRVEEETRLAKIREIEMEQKRQELERQRQIEQEEKRARERLEEKKKMMEADKLLRQKMAHEAKAQRALLEQKQQYQGMYLPKSKDDFGLEDELSEDSDEEDPEPSKRPVPAWVKEAKKGNPLMQFITNKQMKLFMPMPSRTPSAAQLFNVSPKRVRARRSTAVWDTTVASPF